MHPRLSLQVCVLRRLSEIDLLGSNIDQDVLARMEPLEFALCRSYTLRPALATSR